MEQALVYIALIWLLINIFITLADVFIGSQKKLNRNLISENRLNLKIALFNMFREIFEKSIGVSLLVIAWKMLPNLVFTTWSWSWEHFLVCFVCVDFCYFIGHYTNHKVQFFWNQHLVHHSSNEYSLSTGFRVSWLKFAVDWVFFMPLAFLGFPVAMVILSLSLITSYTHLLHIRKIRSLPFVEYILNTPKAHRIHHSSYEAHIDKNMAGVFMLWDHLFKTFTLVDEKNVKFGLTKSLKKSSIVYVNFCEWYKWSQYYKIKGLPESLLFLLRNPAKNKEI